METSFFLPWNRHQLCRGIRDFFAVESLFAMPWNTQSFPHRGCPTLRHPGGTDECTRDTSGALGECGTRFQRSALIKEAEKYGTTLADECVDDVSKVKHPLTSVKYR